MNHLHLEPSDVESQVLLAQQGDSYAIEQVLSHFQSLVRFRARSFFLAGAEQEDLIQEGMIGLFKAIRDYRLDKEIPFRIFAEICINRQLITAIKSSRRLKHQPLNHYTSLHRSMSEDESRRFLIDTLPCPQGSEPDEVVIKQEQLRELQNQLSVILSPFEFQVLNLYSEGHSYKEIAKMMNSTTKAIDNALCRIKRKMDSAAVNRNLQRISS
ncbi:RNA polymerase factor sigma-70 [Effusibacillus consociatus]|uniref:RNA polymerase sigma factor SigS n=1 Tax=Effusibacillus consociatus TaxID=1117041 RepID=A0ABV9Q567_9BACL